MLLTNRLHRPAPAPAWKLLHQLESDVHRELSDWLAASATNKTPLGVWTKDNQALIAVELPGRQTDDIDVSVHRDVVTIETRAAADVLPDGAVVLRRERSHEPVKRQVQLPFEPDAESVEATYERGLLVLRLVAPESARPARIEVKAG